MFYFITGFLGLALVYAHYAVPKRIMDLKRLQKNGVLTQAEVTLARVSQVSRNTPRVTLEYIYKDHLGSEHKSVEQNLSSRFVKNLNEGDKINIKYLTKKPKVSCLADKESANGNSMWVGVIVLIFFDLAIGFGIYSEFYVGK